MPAVRPVIERRPEKAILVHGAEVFSLLGIDKDAYLLGGEIDQCLLNAGNLLECALHPTDTRGAGHNQGPKR
jgi:hypothetical protein